MTKVHSLSAFIQMILQHDVLVKCTLLILNPSTKLWNCFPTGKIQLDASLGILIRKLVSEPIHLKWG